MDAMTEQWLNHTDHGQTDPAKRFIFDLFTIVPETHELRSAIQDRWEIYIAPNSPPKPKEDLYAASRPGGGGTGLDEETPGQGTTISDIIYADIPDALSQHSGLRRFGLGI